MISFEPLLRQVLQCRPNNNRGKFFLLTQHTFGSNVEEHIDRKLQTLTIWVTTATTLFPQSVDELIMMRASHRTIFDVVHTYELVYQSQQQVQCYRLKHGVVNEPPPQKNTKVVDGQENTSKEGTL